MPPEGLSPRHAARQCLALRAWALTVFAGVRPPPAPRAAPAAWSAFLAAERCGLPLRARLGRAAGALDPGARQALAERCDFEAKRSLSVAAHLRVLGPELRRAGWTGVALKGGAEVAEGGELLDILDLDLLLERGRAAEFARLLEGGRGYTPAGYDPGPTLTGGWELAPRLSRGSVPVEVHYDVPHLGGGFDPWREIRPTRVPGVFRLAPATHLWHLLVHSVVHHVARRGQIRELVLLRSAVDACSADEQAVVRAAVDAHRARDPLHATWRMAAALGSGSEAPDRFQAVAAARYAIEAGAGARLPEPLRLLSFAPSAYAMAAGRGEYSRLWYGTRASVLPVEGYRGGTWLDARAPAAALGIRVVSRAARLAAGFPAAWRLHRALRPLLAAGPGEGAR